MKELEKIREKKEMLKDLPIRILKSIVSQHELSPSGSKEDLIEKVAREVSFDEIFSYYQQYLDGGKVTCHLFYAKGIKDIFKEVKSKKDIIRTLESYGYAPQEEVSEKPTLVGVEFLKSGWIKLKYEYPGVPIKYRDISDKKIKTMVPLFSAIVKFSVSMDIIEIRTRNRKIAKMIFRDIIRNLKLTGDSIEFTDKQILEWVEWAKTLRNARVKPLTEGLSSVSLTAEKNTDLRVHSEFKKWIEKGKLRGVIIQFDYKEYTLAIQINAAEGKIFFRSFVGEEEIEFVISQASRIAGLI